jgi:hypothetical protein
VAEVAADKGQLNLLGINVFYFAYSFYGFVLHDVASQTVYGIRWIGNYPAIFQAFYYLFYQPVLWILRMYLYQHDCIFLYSFANAFNCFHWPESII